ncbi:MAG: 2-succinyl-5-enolpyruvyl-6-hydroxy-3-cyclohexene-1-carboxylic-acid synthase [Chloroflexi bacterium]|nr:2-succinyl-5-enolpyruvyl-6-hydroxy-3-cyclohexene-1-carboxylic-acid synthase [Chloroflexota bacterium]
MNANLNAASLFVDELAACGLRHVCIAPGSRNTPLTLAFAAHPSLRVHSLLDERGAAFYALGLALATRCPVAVLCTSGSAVANFFPAVVEAHMSGVPLLVLTADRPHELRHSGANQTIDQIGFFGGYALWSVDMPLPDNAPSAIVMRNLRTTAARALATANGPRPGVVHLNFPFRKPLEPQPADAPPPTPQPGRSPHTFISRGHISPTPDDLATLLALITAHPRGAIVCGPANMGAAGDESLHDAVRSLARASGYPIFADPLSGLRNGDLHVIGAYDIMLSNGGPPFDPTLILRIGAVPTSAALNAAIAAAPADHRIQISASGVWADEEHATSWFLHTDETLLCRELARLLHEHTHPDAQWLDSWQRASRIAERTLRTALDHDWSDGAAVRTTFDAAPADARIFVGNSLAVRHADEFVPACKAQIFGSRGASGIDGNVSTALGIAAADSLRPTIAVLGDVTMLHDLNGLLTLGRESIANAQIVLLNNNGGAIFQRLPIARFDPPFTRLWVTPHDTDFAAAAQAFHLRHARATNANELRTHLQNGVQIIEVVTDAQNDLNARRAARRTVQITLDQAARMQTD